MEAVLAENINRLWCDQYGMMAETHRRSNNDPEINVRRKKTHQATMDAQMVSLGIIKEMLGDQYEEVMTEVAGKNGSARLKVAQQMREEIEQELDRRTEAADDLMKVDASEEWVQVRPRLYLVR
jgi:hypothetical protein